jgi:DNA-binding helix-hairpin-helix protein with protein kinase domain
MTSVVTSKSERLSLGRELGRGGEGAVFEVAGRPSAVAKIYHQPVTASKAAKLAAMQHLATDELLSVASWPTATLSDRVGGPVRGILLPKIENYRDIHILYSPAQRKLQYPKATWAFLIRAARNAAYALSVIHRHGHIIGDVNQGNVLVSPTAMVKLIDCDSFQIVSNGTRFLCEVGVAHYTPPELQGRSFGGVERTTNHDCFGLAVLCFHLLFMGRHPFAGRFHGAGEMPIEKAISEFRFAFSQHAASRQMTPPPNSLRLSHASFEVAALFERAFSTEAARTAARPTAGEWVKALDALESDLTTCTTFAGHKYHRSSHACPWCEIDRAGGPDFFIAVTVGQRLQSGFDLERVWTVLKALQVPTDPAVMPLAVGPPITPVPVPPNIMRRRRFARALGWTAASLAALGLFAGPYIAAAWLAALVIAVACALTVNRSGYAAERARRKAALSAAEQEFNTVKARWDRELNALLAEFNTLRKGLEGYRLQYLALPSEYQRQKAELQAKREHHQRQQYLSQFFIDKHQIPRIGAGLKATLVSYGIETAADLTATAIDRVPGFGQARIRDLLGWRATVEARFRFDPSRGIDPSEVARLDQSFAAKRSNIERSITMDIEKLRKTGAQYQAIRNQLTSEILKTTRRLEQCRADAAMES